MGNRPDVNKRLVGLRIRIELLKKIRLLARENKRTEWKQLVVLLEEATRDVVLSSEDYIEIAQEVKRNEEKRNERVAKEKKNRP